MIWVGCSGWYYPHWMGKFYPDDLKKSKWLEYYCQHFNTVEINSTFYRIPKITTVKGWIRKVPDDFRISLKMNKQLTHVSRFSDSEVIESFKEIVSLVDDKLGCVLVQLPPSLKKDFELLDKMCSMLSELKCRCAIEFRHKSWFDPLVYEKLKDDVVLCLVSSPQVRSPSVFEDYTAEYVYVRFHGTSKWYNHLYSMDELKEWARIIKRFDEAFVYFNNDFNAYAPRNALEMMKLLD